MTVYINNLSCWFKKCRLSGLSLGDSVLLNSQKFTSIFQFMNYPFNSITLLFGPSTELLHPTITLFHLWKLYFVLYPIHLASFYHLDSFLIVDFLYYLFNVAYIDILYLIIPNSKTLGVSMRGLFSSDSHVVQENEINSESPKEFWERSFAYLPSCSSVAALHRMIQPFTPQHGFLLEPTAFSNFLVYRFPLPSLSHNHY